MISKVISVSRSEKHNFSKASMQTINLIEDFGVEGDAHAGKTVQHIYLAKKDPTRKNLLQVHLIANELLDELQTKGFNVLPGALGENITTKGIDLLGLPVGTKLHLGKDAVVELTALRKPCVQIDNFKTGLLKEVVGKDENGKVLLKVGVMGVVLTGGAVAQEDNITIELPPMPHKSLEYVW